MDVDKVNLEMKLAVQELEIISLNLNRITTSNQMLVNESTEIRDKIEGISNNIVVIEESLSGLCDNISSILRKTVELKNRIGALSTETEKKSATLLSKLSAVN